MQVLDTEILETSKEGSTEVTFSFSIFGKFFSKTFLDGNIEAMRKKTAQSARLHIQQEIVEYLFKRDKNKKEGKYFVTDPSGLNSGKDNYICSPYCSRVYRAGGDISFWTDDEMALKLLVRAKDIVV